MNLTQRRVINLMLISLLSIALIWMQAVLSLNFVRTSTLTGWTLFALIIFLASYQARKKIPVRLLGTSSTWMQFHIYAGLLTSVLFVLHTQGSIPGNLFNGVLTLIYLSVFMSGVIGLVLSRYLPARLTHHGEEVIFERIPVHRLQIQNEVEKLLETKIETEDGSSAPSKILGQLYQEHLKDFFEKPRNQFAHFFQRTVPRKKLQRLLEYQKQILSEPEQEIVSEIQQWAEKKDHLDYAYTIQGCLKLWLFIHVPLTYALIVFAVFHVIVISAFSGGAL